MGSHGAPWGDELFCPTLGCSILCARPTAPHVPPRSFSRAQCTHVGAHGVGGGGKPAGTATHPQAPTLLWLHNMWARCRLCVGILRAPNVCQEPEATPGVGWREPGVGVELRPTGAPRADTQQHSACWHSHPCAFQCPAWSHTRNVGSSSTALHPPQLLSRGAPRLPQPSPPTALQEPPHCVLLVGGCQHCCCAPHQIPCLGVLRAASSHSPASIGM